MPLPTEHIWIDVVQETLNQLSQHCHEVNAKWYKCPITGEPIDTNIAEKLALIHSEISEALEGHRKGLLDSHLKDRPMIEVELADALIRIFDLCGYLRLDLGGALVSKMAYNQVRADHSKEARLAAGGKKY